VMVETRRGEGTTFRLILPLTLATFRGILVSAGGRPFMIPTARVDRVLRVLPQDVRTVAGRKTILVGGQAVALVSLGDLLNLPRPADAPPPAEMMQAVVVVSGDQRAAFGVDEVSNEQEVLVKSMGAGLRRVRHVAAATILGSGQLVPILDAADLVESAAAAGAPATTVEPAAPRQKRVLIAEDSITSRMLLKNILEGAGYHAQTAVDGQFALEALRRERFDLVVSDVEMPRMDGFELTAAIRGDTSMQDLPVVLVTSREARADRERGIDVGANAYLVKSSFDQSNLIDVVRKLA
jgi:two-component system, chemotaxis family, sensor kinase CheA